MSLLSRWNTRTVRRSWAPTCTHCCLRQRRSSLLKQWRSCRVRWADATCKNMLVQQFHCSLFCFIKLLLQHPNLLFSFFTFPSSHSACLCCRINTSRKADRRSAAVFSIRCRRPKRRSSLSTSQNFRARWAAPHLLIYTCLGQICSKTVECLETNIYVYVKYFSVHGT